MSKLNPSDIQGFVLRGYGMPLARYVFVELGKPEHTRDFLGALLPMVTTGQKWEGGKPKSTLNVAFTFAGLEKLELPLATLVSFPVEFQMGMRARKEILNDCGTNDPSRWDPLWQQDEIHLWVAIHAFLPEDVDAASVALEKLLTGDEGREDSGISRMPARWWWTAR